MRGGLDDALARMARWEQLRRRVSDARVSPAAALEEVVQAARRAVGRDTELAITVTVAYRGRASAVRVENQAGEVIVSVPADRPEPSQPVDLMHSAPPPPPPPRASTPAPPPPPPAAPPPMASAATLPSPLAPAPLPTVPPSAASQLAELLRHSDGD